MEVDLSRATYDVEEVAQLLGLGRSATYAAVSRGEIPSLRIGRRIVIPHAAVQKLLNGDNAAFRAREPLGAA